MADSPEKGPNSAESPFIIPEGSGVGRSARLAMGASKFAIKTVLKHIAEQDRETISAFHKTISTILSQAQIVADLLHPTSVRGQSVTLPSHLQSPWAVQVRQTLSKDLAAMKPRVNYWPVHSSMYGDTEGAQPINAEWFSLNSNYTVSQSTQRLISVDKRARCILYFHGGAFITGSSSWVIYKDFIRSLMSRIYDNEVTRSLRVSADAPKPRPLVALSIDYRLVPNSQFPAAIQDGVAAYQYLVEALGLDPSQIIIGGDSAGGTVAAGVALALQRIGAPTPGGLLLFSPWLDLSLSGTSMSELKQDDPIIPADSVPTCVRALLSVVKARRGSALQTGFLPTPPPTDGPSWTPTKFYPLNIPLYSSAYPSIKRIVDNPDSLTLSDEEKKALTNGQSNVSYLSKQDTKQLDWEDSEEAANAAIAATRNGLYQLQRHPLVSPLFASRDALSKLPPTLIVAGGREILLDDSTRFFQALSASGGKSPSNGKDSDQNQNLSHSFSKYQDLFSGIFPKVDKHPIGSLMRDLGLDDILNEEAGNLLRNLADSKVSLRKEINNLLIALDKEASANESNRNEKSAQSNAPADLPDSGKQSTKLPALESAASPALKESINTMVSDVEQFKQHASNFVRIARRDLSDEAKKNLRALLKTLDDDEDFDLSKLSSRSLIDEAVGAKKFWRRLEDEASVDEAASTAFFRTRTPVRPITFVSIPPSSKNGVAQQTAIKAAEGASAAVADAARSSSNPPMATAIHVSPRNGDTSPKVHQLTVWPGMMHVFSLFGLLPGAREANGAIDIAAQFASQNVWDGKESEAGAGNTTSSKTQAER